MGPADGHHGINRSCCTLAAGLHLCASPPQAGQAPSEKCVVAHDERMAMVHTELVWMNASEPPLPAGQSACAVRTRTHASELAQWAAQLRR